MPSATMPSPTRSTIRPHRDRNCGRCCAELRRGRNRGREERPTPRLSAPVPLTSEHDLSSFDCGEPALNDWLRERALKDESRFSRTYVVGEGNRVVAHFCISAGAVKRSEAPGKVRRNAP